MKRTLICSHLLTHKILNKKKYIYIYIYIHVYILYIHIRVDAQ
jgi:hypothetical protein